VTASSEPRGAGPVSWQLLVLALAAVWAAASHFLPVTQDEAYYYAWSSALDFGYFDHPPLVALVGWTSQLGSSAVVARAGTVLCAVATALALLRLTRVLGLGRSGQVAALALALFNVMGLAVGVLTTPDAPLMLFWTLALTEAALAVAPESAGGDPRRWLSAGLVTGLGLTAKYTMLLMGPVFLWALWRATPKGAAGAGRGLRSPWPYAGGLVALLAWTPHLWWNAQHDWITFKFQTRHGFAMERPEGFAVSLPRPLPEDPNAPEALLAGSFAALHEAEAAEDYSEKPWDGALKRLNRHVGWYGSQLAFWGAYLLGGIWLAWEVRRRRGDATVTSRDDDARIHGELRPLLHAGVVVPLGVFGLLTFVSKVEANWSAMYVVAAAPLLARWALRAPRVTAACAAANVLVASVAVLHARVGVLPSPRPHRDRLLVETHGYDALAAELAKLQGPVFADSYQITAMTRFYRPELKTRQWPGITRDSEFLRAARFTDVTAEDLAKHGVFWLVTTDAVPPRLPGFAVDDMAQLRDCQAGGLQVINARSLTQDGDVVESRCKPPIHEWYLVRYVRPSVPS
jgi:4-amino-4-deoxy-L-arabinose transferase-like glycosyltransferase